MNSVQEIYQAYALLQSGDICITYNDETDAGHSRMVKAEPDIVYNNGNIDEESSYVSIIEQTDTHPDSKNDYTSWKGAGESENKLSFSYLYNNNYIPVTCEVFELGYTIEPWVRIYNENTAADIANGLKGTLHSNYRINAIYISIDIQGGGNVFSTKYVPNLYFYSLENLEDVNNEISSLSSGYYRINIAADTGPIMYKDGPPRTHTVLDLIFSKD